MDERFELLAELLSYPSERTATAAARVGLARLFREVPLARQQEIFTATFDLQPACAPYFGHHLLGEDSPVRGPLLARLAGLYREHGFTPREELPDHVAEVLRFLAVAPPSEERDDLVRDGLLPALRSMIGSFEDTANPYRAVLGLAELVASDLVPAAISAGLPRTERSVAP